MYPRQDARPASGVLFDHLLVYRFLLSRTRSRWYATGLYFYGSFHAASRFGASAVYSWWRTVGLFPCV